METNIRYQFDRKLSLDKLYRKARLDSKNISQKLESGEKFVGCKKCNRRALKETVIDNMFVCPLCGNHMSIGAYHRLWLLLDKGSFNEIDDSDILWNPIGFPGYVEKLQQQKTSTGLKEAVVSGIGRIDGNSVVVVVMDNRFLMGSMSSWVGEKITRAVETANRAKLPLIIFSSSGGARMQEGMYSLIQMAKTASAVKEFSDNGGLFISVFTNPTMGGVTASFATLGDITLAEPGALIGFAGQRVIEQTINEKLPAGFQKSEYQEKHGFVDKIVERKDLRSEISKILKLHARMKVLN